MLQAPKMNRKNTNKSSGNRSTPTTNIPTWSQQPSDTAPQRTRANTGGTSLNYPHFPRGQGTEINQRPINTRSFFVRNDDVKDALSDSESEHEENPVVEPIGTKQKTLMRNPTVMTIHSDSEYEQEDNQELARIGTNNPVDAKLAGTKGRLLPLGLTGQKAPKSRQGTVKSFEPTASNEILYMGLAGTLNRDDYIDPGVTDTVEVSIFGDDDDNIEQDTSQVQHGRHDDKPINMNYLLAPMDFDDDEGSGNITIIEGYTEAVERFQIFAGVNEFDESDQLGLGEHPYRVVPKNRRRDQERILENKRRQGKLLLVSLLDNFCLLYEQSPERSRKLFYVICKTLSSMGIIDEEYLEEMSAVRSSYQRAFRSLVVSALTSIKQEQMILESRRIMAPPSSPTDDGIDSSSNSSHYPTGSLSPRRFISSTHLHTPPISVHASTPMMRTTSFGDMFDNDPTRYKNDFVEIGKLGRGGFASVFKARNKLDEIEYAIKKIRLRGGDKVRYEKTFREIKFLARLEHQNVIRYYSSWLEHADYPVSKRDMYGDGTGGIDTQGLEDEYDDEYMDEEGYTNTTSMADGASRSKLLGRRNSVDYFGPHREQHPLNPEDLSMSIVFGADEDEDDGISFENSSTLENPDEDQASGCSNGPDSCALMDNEDQGSSYSSSATPSSHRDLPPTTDEHGRKREMSMSSQEIHETSNWEEREVSRDSLSNADSVLSTSIEEIQRSLPSSFSGLGSRYSHSQNHRDQTLCVRMNEHDLRPSSFPNIKSGAIGGLGGRTQKLVTRELTLYIQMQLCQTTLQDYLVYRNERPVSVPRPAELSKKLSTTTRIGALSSSGNIDQKTHSTPGSPLQQTCHKDLVDPAVNRHIFRAIVEGVAYIHDQDMIHRDLKPSNIFLGIPPGLEYQRAQQLRHEQSYDSLQSRPLTTHRNGGSQHSLSLVLRADDHGAHPLTKDQIQEELFMHIESMIPKIGDFGLVTDMDGTTLDGDGSQNIVSDNLDTSASGSGRLLLRRHSSSATTGSRSSRTRTTAVGTVTYASPEQLARPNLGYDQKADIYSLGIIFFELYHPFSTLMERHAVLRTLRRGELPPDFVSRWPKEAAFVLWLMAEDPRMRPTAREILEFDLIRKPKEEPLVNTGTKSGGESNPLPSDSFEASGVSDAPSERDSTPEALSGLGLDMPSLSGSISPTGPVPSVSKGRIICEACQTRCQCPAEASDIGTSRKVVDDMNQTYKSPSAQGHHSSRSASSKVSRSELEHRLKEECDKVKRLEMSMANIRAENRALLDRIEAMEKEKGMP